MTAEEKVTLLHEKMDALRHVRERRKTGIIGAAGVIMAVCLLLLLFKGDLMHNGGIADLYSGAAMLFEDAGGYVLAALAAFTAGVIITAVIIKRQNNKNHDEDV